METLRDRIIVQRLGEGEQKVGGIVVPDPGKEKPQQGKVIAAGSGKRKAGGGRLALDVKAGDVITFGKFSGEEIKLEGEEYLIMREDEVLAVIDSPSPTSQMRRAPGRLDVTAGQRAWHAIETLTALEKAAPVVRSGRGSAVQSRFKMLRALVSAGLVKTGPKGYQLARPLSKITVKEIMTALEEPKPSLHSRRNSSSTQVRRAKKAMRSANPEERYVASEGLVSLLKQHSPVLSKEEAAALRAQVSSGARSLLRNKDLAAWVGERIEGLLGNLARRAAASGGNIVRLADDRRFDPEIGAELIERLDVDPYFAQEFLDELHGDFREFVSVPRVRSWGQIATDGGNLVLSVVVDRAKRPDFSDLLERPWVTR